MFILSNFNARDSRDNLTLIIREDVQCVSTLCQNHPQGYMNRIFHELIHTRAEFELTSSGYWTTTLPVELTSELEAVCSLYPI